MTTNQLSYLDQATLSDIVGFSWEMFIDGRPFDCPPSRPAEGVAATISISGGWNATLEVTLSEPLARRFAAAMLSDDPESLDIDDITDAVGELANIVGGNVKGLLDDELDPMLSLPTVTTDLAAVPGGEVTLSSGYDCGDGEVMTWSLHEVG